MQKRPCQHHRAFAVPSGIFEASLASQALCTEASLVALRRSYPQIYSSDDKLLVDPRTVSVTQPDFEAAFRSITPASGRSVGSPAR